MNQSVQHQTALSDLDLEHFCAGAEKLPLILDTVDSASNSGSLGSGFGIPGAGRVPFSARGGGSGMKNTGRLIDR